MKSSQLELFRSLNLMLRKFRYAIKINTNVPYLNTLEDCLKILKENEDLFEAYKTILHEQQNATSSTKKVKRSPYKHIIAAKLSRLSSLTNKYFQQITFILKEMLFFSIFQSVDFNAHMLWNLEVVGVYNKLIETVNMLPASCLNSSSCSNNFPNLLLPQSPMHLGVIFTLVFNQHIEENILDILYRVLNVNVIRKLNTETDSTSSSLEVLKVLTNNIISDNVNLWGLNFDQNSSTLNPENWISQNGKFICSNSMAPFLQNYNACLSKFLSDYRHKMSPSFAGNDEESEKLNTEINNGLRIVWAYISSILDHAMLWWIDTPMCSYPLSFVDIIRSWILLDGLTDTQEPISSCLKALCEILTTYISNNAWDGIFRIALVKSTYSRNAFNDFEYMDKHLVGSANGNKIWCVLFNHLKKSNNNILLISESFTRQAAVAEQIPILHRIDHSLHTMRIWATEQSKLQSSKWVIDALFQVLNIDVKECLQIVSMIDFQKIEVDLKEILMTVCIYLRAKLILEIKANISKLGNTKDECIKVLSSVCSTLALAHFSLCFPPRHYWQRDYVGETQCGYVSFILDEIFLPALQSTKDITTLELILKLICEAWIDYIYSQQIKFTECGALTLLNDFDEVQKWIQRVDFLSVEEIKRLCNHEVLHMCKGVGKVLVRKPKEIISIAHPPKNIESSSERMLELNGCQRNVLGFFRCTLSEYNFSTDSTAKIQHKKVAFHQRCLFQTKVTGYNCE